MVGWFPPGLTSLVLPNKLTRLGHWCFSGCSGLTGSLALPDTLVELGDFAFNGCCGLTSLTLPHALARVGIYAFQLCSGLASVAFRPCMRGTSGPFIAWAVGNSRNRDRWQLTTLKHSRNVLR